MGFHRQQKRIINVLLELSYPVEGSALLDSDLDKIPMILSGDFSANFASAESQPLIEFLQEKLQLNMTNDPREATRSGTTIDAVFTRFLNNFKSKIFISYFSYHKPIVSFLEPQQMETDQYVTLQSKCLNFSICTSIPLNLKDDS
jgi:hypothetical protein